MCHGALNSQGTTSAALGMSCGRNQPDLGHRFWVKLRPPQKCQRKVTVVFAEFQMFLFLVWHCLLLLLPPSHAPGLQNLNYEFRQTLLHPEDLRIPKKPETQFLPAPQLSSRTLVGEKQTVWVSNIGYQKDDGWYQKLNIGLFSLAFNFDPDPYNMPVGQMVNLIYPHDHVAWAVSLKTLSKKHLHRCQWKINPHLWLIISPMWVNVWFVSKINHVWCHDWLLLSVFVSKYFIFTSPIGGFLK